ncbi:MAG: ribonuclease E/G [Lachnospiraceae bacterium]|nr:ribonuclease E/G [Lachnospiraceae bacterium]
MSTKNTEHLKVLNRPFKGKLADGDEVLLQVRREPQKTKEYAVSCNIELRGHFCVAKFGSGRLFFSKNHQENTKDVISSNFRQKALCTPDGSLIGYSYYDLILRTSAEKLTRNDPEGMDILYQDCADTLSALDHLVRDAYNRSCFSVLEKPAGWSRRILDDISACGFYVSECVTDSYRLYTSLQTELKSDPQIRFYQDSQVSLPVLYNISSRIEEALNTKVWLKNGGYLCIEQTEAMTVVDVNTGKATRGKDAEKLFF